MIELKYIYCLCSLITHGWISSSLSLICHYGIELHLLSLLSYSVQRDFAKYPLEGSIALWSILEGFFSLKTIMKNMLQRQFYAECVFTEEETIHYEFKSTCVEFYGTSRMQQFFLKMWSATDCCMWMECVIYSTPHSLIYYHLLLFFWIKMCGGVYPKSCNRLKADF